MFIFLEVEDINEDIIINFQPKLLPKLQKSL